jgi:pimeloyl-ACP methyl ester carboxylesterase
VLPYAERALATPDGRRRATQLTTVNYEHIPAELLAHQMLGVARCDVVPMVEYALGSSYPLDVGSIGCPVRIVWGTADRLLPWPSAAVRYRESLPHADWVELDGVGHLPQLDVPTETAQLILGFTSA